jgi:hypothetical protein
MGSYPDWSYFPRRTAAPAWVEEFVETVGGHKSQIESYLHDRLDSDQVLDALRSRLVEDGWQIEAGKKDVDKIFRPVLFGDSGISKVNYEIDGWHPIHKVVLEIESGRGWQGNAFFRDLIRTSLIQGADYLAVGLRTSYSYASVKNQNDFIKARDQMDAIFASGRLLLPFEGILVFGW